MKTKRLLLLAAALFLILVAAFAVWGADSRPPDAIALQALESNSQVTVTVDDWQVFSPTGHEPSVGFIFYPGGKVNPAAYAPLLQEIAAQGYLVISVPMPLNLAVLGSNRAEEVIAAYPQIETWAIGGHSLGGAMAAQFTSTHPDQIAGLVLWAAYPAESSSLRYFEDQTVVSIYGSLDGLATLEKIDASISLLPPDTEFIEITGGNHAQFGYYGPQEGDNPATISAAEQRAQIVRATLALLQQIEK